MKIECGWRRLAAGLGFCWFASVGQAVAQPAAAVSPQGVYEQIKLGNVPAARKLGQELVQREPSDVWHWVALANAHFAAQDWRATRQTLDEARALLGNRPELDSVAGSLASAEKAAATPLTGPSQTPLPAAAAFSAAGKPAAALDRAYAALQQKEDALALEAFRQAAAGTLAPDANADAAFTALRLRLDTDAVSFFKAAIDGHRIAGNSGLSQEREKVFALQRAVAEVQRRFGVSASVTVGQQQASASTGLTGSLAGSNTVAGLEIYARPGGYRGGSYTDYFLRAYSVLRDSLGGATGSDATVYSAGVRLKPLPYHSLFLNAWHRWSGQAGDPNDLAWQVAYFNGAGTDLRRDVPAWWTWQVSADAGRLVRKKMTFGSLDTKWGRSWSTLTCGENCTAQAFVFLHTDHNSADTYTTRSTVGIGAAHRFWFRGDAHTAPMSYADLEWRYRLSSHGGGQTQASSLQFAVSY